MNAEVPYYPSDATAPRNSRWWLLGLVGGLLGGILPPAILILDCYIHNDGGGPMFLPIACTVLFIVGGFFGLLIGIIVWLMLRRRATINHERRVLRSAVNRL